MGHDESNENKNPQYEKMISSLKGIDVEPSSYMKTRVLARAREINEQKQAKRFSWKSLIFVAAATAFVVLMVSRFVFIEQQEPGLEVGKPYVVKADLRSMNDLGNVAYVQVELDGEIQFSSKKFSRIREMRSLKLSWEKLVGKQYLPVIVEGTSSGNSVVRVKFFGKDNKVIKTEEYDFSFDRGQI